MSRKEDYLIGQLLVSADLINQEQLESGLRHQKKSGGLICTTLAKLGFAPEAEIFAVLSRQLNIPYVRLKEVKIDPAVITKVPAKFAIHYKIIPLELNNDTLKIAISDPLNIHTLDDIKLLLGLEVEAVLANEEEILALTRKHYGVGADTLESIVAKETPSRDMETSKNKIEKLEDMAEDASIIKFVNQILSEAIKDRATDIHLEPFQNELRTRYRIDGILYDINTPETIRYFHSAIVSRVKIMASLDISEHRLPQDGRIKIKINSDELDLRVSIMPTAFGEAIHVRILSPQFFLELKKLGLLTEDLKTIEEVIKKPHGIIFVSGPTGSGKSTTLYACLEKINSSGIKIITIEDPIEYQLRGVNQVQVVPQIGFNFASALRHMLRHDPDVMMVGEVRDFETAEIAIRSALTGHLVFSTLHTNDAAGAVTRLLEMGIEPFLVSSSLECLVAQRLVRLICPKCRRPDKSRDDIIKKIKGNLNFDPKKAQISEGKGCPECRFTGFRGRTGIYEILRISQPIRELILRGASSQQIKEQAISEGMRTLTDDGLRKVVSGLTTYTEVMRVSQEDESI